MLEYPSIGGPKEGRFGKECHAFLKYDGSNLRFEWTSKRGWWKFGTRTRLFDHQDIQFGDAIPLFFGTIAQHIPVNDIVKKHKNNVKRINVFCEYFGYNSFAGSHDPNDEKQLKILDIAINGVFVKPSEFLLMFGHADNRMAHWLGSVTYNQSVIEEVMDEDSYNSYHNLGLPLGMHQDQKTIEGVVFKGLTKNGIWRCKVKTKEWIDKLKSEKSNWQELT